MTHPEDLALLAFYRGDAADASGRRLDEIWSWTDVRLEAVHDYIQWMFPLSVRSGANPAAPVLGPLTAEAFGSSEALRERLKRSLRVMLRFYGLEETRIAGALRTSEASVEARFGGHPAITITGGSRAS